MIRINQCQTGSILVIIFLCVIGVNVVELPPDPNNAALLYYHAIALWADVRSAYMDTDEKKVPDETLDDLSKQDDSKTVDISDLIRMYQKADELRRQERQKAARQQKRRQTIELIEAASKVPECAWGKMEWGRPPITQFRDLVYLLKDDAEVLAADGNYHTALERCFTTRRFTRHIGDGDFTLYNTSLSLDTTALLCTKNILEAMPLNVEMLKWLQNQLLEVQITLESSKKALEYETKRALLNMRKNPESFMEWKAELAAKSFMAGSQREEMVKILNLTYEQLIDHAQKSSTDFVNSFVRVLDSDLSYEDKCKELQKLVDNLRKSFTDPTKIMFVTDRLVDLYYRFQIRHDAYYNALRAAMEVYLIKAETGQLPKSYPAGLPKDPYSDNDFKYEITRDGFVLSCTVGQKTEPVQKFTRYEFKVKDNP